jgi:hypothetical protein
LGRDSRNGATYQWDTCSKQYRLYEGAKVFCHHGSKDTQFPFGRIQNVTAKPDGFYGDIKYNPKLPTTEGVLWYIDNDPSAIGMSPDHIVKMEPGPNGSKLYTDIIRVNSVDFVSDPATTKGVFESMNPDGTFDSKGNDARLGTGGGGEGDQTAAFESQLAELFATGVKTLGPEKFRAVAKHLLNAHGVLGEGEGESKETEALKKENAELKTKLDGYQVLEKVNEQKKLAAKLCKEAQLPDYAVTEHFIDTLAAKDEAAMKLDIADRKKLAQVRESKPISPDPTAGKPTNLDQFCKYLTTGQM